MAETKWVLSVPGNIELISKDLDNPEHYGLGITFERYVKTDHSGIGPLTHPSGSSPSSSGVRTTPSAPMTAVVGVHPSL